MTGRNETKRKKKTLQELGDANTSSIMDLTEVDHDLICALPPSG